MKVQAINNNTSYYSNSISHKAYFKKNEAFQTLYDKAEKTKVLQQLAKNFRELVPMHELEITGVIGNNTRKQNWLSYDIRNNVTGKKTSIFTSNDSQGLIGVLSHLCLIREKDFFIIGKESQDIDCFDILTKKG